LYGGGGGGRGQSPNFVGGGTVQNGAQGIIVITYVPAYTPQGNRVARLVYLRK